MRSLSNLRRHARRFENHAGGATAVEFALIMPVLLAIVLGTCVYGLYLGAAHSLREIAAEAARASVAGISDDERASLARQRVDAALLTGGSMFPAGTVTVQVGPDPADATLYNVTLSFDAKSLKLSGLSALLPMPGDVLTSTVSVRRGGL